MAGHVFLVWGDLRQLACDAWLMPADTRGRTQDKWLSPGFPVPYEGRPPREWEGGKLRVLPVRDWPAGAPRPWLVNVEGDERTPAEWYLEGVRQFLAEAGRWLKDGRRSFTRPTPLVALPLVGTGEGGGRERAGQILAALLGYLREEASRADFDLAVVVHDGPAFAAAQAAREQQGTDPWPELDDSLKDQARRLAEKASRGELALFVGAGVSASAGLPLWGELLQKLAEKVGMSQGERGALGRLNPLDQAGIIEKRLDGPEGLQQALRDLFTRSHYSLAHGLLAALPVHEVVTTNYDQLFEFAWAALRRRASVLPYEIDPGADRWMLKMHGCVSHAEDLVLTREDVIGYERRHTALAGVVQALLITRHMLFVGFSLNDDNFHRIAAAVRRVVRPAGRDTDPKSFGTAVVLERNPLIEELWGRDLEWVGMAPPPTSESDGRDAGEEARRLDIFLDYLLAQARDTGYLLDDRYQALLSPAEAEVREALLRLEKQLSPAARKAPAWKVMAEALRRLGLQGPDSKVSGSTARGGRDLSEQLQHEHDRADQ